MTLEQAKVWLDMGSDIVLCMDIGRHYNTERRQSEPLHIWIIMKAKDFYEEDFERRFSDLVRGHSYTLKVDDGCGLELLRDEKL